MELKRQVFLGVKASGLGSLVVGGLRMLQLFVLARLVAPEAFGIFAMTGIVLGLATHLLEIGAGAVVVQRQSLSAEALSNLFWVGLGTGICALLLLLFAAPLLAALFGEPRLEDALRWLSPVPLLTQVGLPYRSVLERDLRMGRLASIEIVAALASVAVAISAALAGGDLAALVASHLLGAAVASSLYVSQGWRSWRPRLRIEARAIAGEIRFGANLAAQRLVNYVTANVDFLLVGTFGGSGTLGHYSMAYNLANLPSTHINRLFGRVAFPALARTQDDLTRTRANYLRIQQTSMLVNGPLVLGLAAVAPLAVPTVLGPTWTPSVPLLQVLCAVGLARCIGGGAGPLLLARGRPDLGLRWALLMAALHAPALIAGFHFGGALGVAVAFAVAQAIAVYLSYRLLVRALLGQCGPAFIRSAVLPCTPAVAMAALVAGLGSLMTGVAPAAALCAQIAFGVIAYGALVFIFYPQFATTLRQVAVDPQAAA
jgi:O-antigen/teichoic acid export membrane protein